MTHLLLPLTWLVFSLLLAFPMFLIRLMLTSVWHMLVSVKIWLPIVFTGFLVWKSASLQRLLKSWVPLSYTRDQPGEYIIMRGGTRVNDGPLLTDAQVDSLGINTRVDVVEMVTNTDIDRVRAKIANPQGWISLKENSTGSRWARRAEVQEDFADLILLGATRAWRHCAELGVGRSILMSMCGILGLVVLLPWPRFILHLLSFVWNLLIFVAAAAMLALPLVCVRQAHICCPKAVAFRRFAIVYSLWRHT